MRKPLTAIAVAAAFTIIPMSSALATTPPNPEDPNDVTAIDNPLDDNDESSSFDDWGLLGLIGLVGLAGLGGRRRDVIQTTYDDRSATRI